MDVYRFKDGKENEIRIIYDGVKRTRSDVEKSLDELKTRVHFSGRSSAVDVHYPTSLNGFSIMNMMSFCHVSLGSGMKIQKNLLLRLNADHTKILIGNNCTFGGVDMLIDEPKISISIGNDCLFGFDVSFRTGDGHTIFDSKTKEILNYAKNITLEDHIWVGRSVVLLKNTGIKRDCVVGLGSIVNKTFDESNCILAGIPARIVRRSCNWDIRGIPRYSVEMRT